LSADGNRIIAGSSRKTLHLLDMLTGQQIEADLQVHQGDVEKAALSPDGNYIVTGSSMNKTLSLWDAKTLQPIGVPVNGHDDAVTSVAFSPDGRSIVSGSKDKTLRLWPAPKTWPDELCKKLTRNMSHKEWREWVSPEIDYEVQCPGLPIQPDKPDNTKEKP